MTSTTRGTATLTQPSDETLLITRDFNAPPHAVYAAWTTPALISQWWSGHASLPTEVEMDLRPGGHWRFVIPGDAPLAFHGTYREVVPDIRIVYTEVMETADADRNDPAAEAAAPVNTVTFEARGAGTTLTLLIDAGTTELRDVILNSGMEHGMQAQMDMIEGLTSGPSQ